MFDPGSAFDMSQRVAIVTGGSRGLGRAIAFGLARAGAHVVVASRKLDHCRAVAEEIERDTGVTALAHPVHTGRWEEATALVDSAYARFGRLDVLVNNAGMSPLYPDLESVTEDLFDKVVAVNLKGPFRIAVLAGTRMAAGHGGCIINISSVGAVRPRPGMLPYAAAKAGLNAVTIGLAHAFGPSVRCNAIMAGTFFTDVSKSWDPEVFAERAKTFALRRGAAPEEIVGTCLYLASDASSYTTGTIMKVDGGQP